MTTPIVEVDTFTAQLLTILDGDPANAATMLALLQPLANRSKNLKTLVDANTAAIALKASQAAIDDLLQWTPEGAHHIFARPIIGGTTVSLVGLAGATATGSATGRVLADTNYGTRRHRIGFSTTTTPGTLCGTRLLAQSSVAPLQGNAGYRACYRHINTVMSPNSRWFNGCVDGIAAPTNVDPATLTNMFGIGSNGHANVQVICNDASGVATLVDLGANFPALTANAAYELLVTVQPGGTAYGWKVRRLDVPVPFVATGIASSNVPAPSAFGMPSMWGSNNTDAQIITMDWMGVDMFCAT